MKAVCLWNTVLYILFGVTIEIVKKHISDVVQIALCKTLHGETLGSLTSTNEDCHDLSWVHSSHILKDKRASTFRLKPSKRSETKDGLFFLLQ